MTDTLEVRADVVGRDDDLHVCDSPDGALVLTMLCGRSCVVLADGALVPMLDHYAMSAGFKATCPECRAAWRRA